MVTTHPPTHCGIGSYAEQNIAQLRSQGHVVDVVSPDGGGNVDYAWDLRGGTKILKLRELAPYYDRIVIQYTWAFFYSDVRLPEYRKDTLKTTLSFLYLFLRYRKIQVIVHEIPYLEGRMRKLFGWHWKFVDIVFHTRAERERLETHYGIRLRNSRVELRDHHHVFQRFANHTQASARRSLGIPGAQTVFLCIGFIQRHKGFHRAIRAFVESGLKNAQLYVVGSLRFIDGETLGYLNELREQAEGHPNINILESFVSSEEFDTWIIAADWVVFPYTEIWSSGVLARTRLLERPSIIADLGGLPDQAGGRDILFRSDEDLVRAFQCAAEQLPEPVRSNR
jgi:glycosyltransferase involved in cell wall biosynthesis